MARGAVSGILVMIEGVGLTRAMANQLRREGYRVHCLRDLDRAGHVLQAGRTPDFLFVALPEGECSIEEMRNEIAMRLPGWSIEVRNSSGRIGAGGAPGKDARRLPN